MTTRSIRVRLLALALVVGLAAAGGATAQTFGGVDFTRYVAVGDSITAGFISSGLVAPAQQTSYPALIYKATHGGSLSGFALPTVSAPGIPAVLQLTSLSPLTLQPAAGQGAPTNLTLPRPYDNLAVPGARVHDAVATVSGGLHDLVLRGLGTQVQQAAALSPTFVTLWIGNNDVLAAATSGVVIEGVTLTPVAAFRQDFRAAASVLAGVTGGRIAVATIPDVTAIPFVTTLPPVVVNPATNQPVLIGGNPVPLIGPGGRALVPGRDFVLLTATTELRQGRGIPTFLGGTGQPLSNQSVLDAAEVATVRARTNAFNDVIRAETAAVGGALVDIHAFFDEVKAHGFEVGGVTLTADFLTGGVFSYDGVHPTAIGQAVIANEFIAAINARYNSNVPFVNLRPFLFGPLGSAGTGFPVGAAASQLHFTRRAEEHLRFGLDVPSRKQMNRILRRSGLDR